MEAKIENTGIFLKDSGIKPSYQRIRIYNYLLENRIHPTVDTIFKNLVSEIPTLSKTTVYNTLNLFIEKGIVNIIVIEENETRYDVDTSVHGHFKCEACRNVFDFVVDSNFLNNDNLKGFHISEKHIYLRGRCKNCTC